MTKFSTKLLHLKFWILGDKKLEKEGRVIPCKNCDKLFKSYTHFGEWSYVYDSLCKDCKRKKIEGGKKEMGELELKEPIEMIVEQFECPSCKKKIYVNVEDVKDEVLDCPFCSVAGIKNVRLFRIEVQKIFEKD